MYPSIPQRSLSAGDVLPALLIAVASIAFAPILQTANSFLAIAVQSLVACAIVIATPAYAASCAIFILLFQNLFVSILSSNFSTPSELEFVKGYNFLVCSVMWLATVALYMLRQRNHSPEINRIMAWGFVALAVVMLYFAMGAVHNRWPLRSTCATSCCRCSCSSSRC